MPWLMAPRPAAGAATVKAHGRPDAGRRVAGPMARCYASHKDRSVEGSIDYAPSLFALSVLVAIQGAFVALVLSTRMRAAAGLPRLFNAAGRAD